MPLQLPHRAYISSQLVTTLREAIVSGDWTDRLPSERTLSTMLKVSRMTLRKALSTLEREGVIAANPGNSQRRILKPSLNPRSTADVTITIVRSPKPSQVVDLDLWQHRLQLRLAQEGIPSNVLFFSNRQLRSKQQAPQNWITPRVRRFWVLVDSTPEMQLWFSRHAADQTLVVGTSLPDSKLPFIDRDYRTVGRHAAGFLLGRKHRKVAMLGLKNPVVGDRETEAGFQETILSHGEATCQVMRHDSSKRDLFRQLERMFSQQTPPSALFLYKASLSLAAIIRLLQMGIEIPKKLSLIARDQSSAWDALPFDLAHYLVPPDRIADQVLVRVRQHLESPSKPMPSSQILSEFQPGNSVVSWTPS